MHALAAAAPPEIAVVCAQNGVENERLALRHFAHVYAMCVMLPGDAPRAGGRPASSAPITGLLDLGRYPTGSTTRAGAIAAALERSTFESIPRADVMRWKYRKLLMNLANAAEALCGPGDGVGRARAAGALRGRSRAATPPASTSASLEEDQERRADRMQIKPIAGAMRGGGSSWQSLRRGTGTIETDYLNGEIVLLGREHGVDDARSTRCCNDSRTTPPVATRRPAASPRGPPRPPLTVLSGVLAADRDDLAGHVRREVAGEEDDDVGDLPRLGRAAERLARRRARRAAPRS